MKAYAGGSDSGANQPAASGRARFSVQTEAMGSIFRHNLDSEESSLICEPDPRRIVQRLAVASVLVLGLLAGASVFMILSQVYGQAQPQVGPRPQSSQVSSATATANTNSTSTSTNSVTGLLTTATTHTSYHDDD
jgi:hypothetical protein